ncbi:MAG: hypothetical protein WD533_09520 [Dehalococcoidia bacterium]
MALILFLLMTVTFLAVGFLARRYGPTQRFILLAVSVLTPVGLLGAWLAGG